MTCELTGKDDYEGEYRLVQSYNKVQYTKKK